MSMSNLKWTHWPCDPFCVLTENGQKQGWSGHYRWIYRLLSKCKPIFGMNVMFCMNVFLENMYNRFFLSKEKSSLHSSLLLHWACSRVLSWGSSIIKVLTCVCLLPTGWEHHEINAAFWERHLTSEWTLLAGQLI